MLDVEFRDLGKTFRTKSASVTALEGVNLDIEKGSIFGVVGTSGAGKSTLLRTINGLEKPTAGSVNVLGRDLNALSKKQLRELRGEVSMVFQHFNLLDTQTVAQNVAMPLILAKTPKKEIQQRVSEVLEMVGLEGRAQSLPKQLSGGQRQRVGIARALITNPKILLCDEPTSALDPLTTDQILDLIVRVNQELDITVVIITHEMGVISRIADTVVVMEDGHVIENGSVSGVFSDPQQPLTQRLVETVLPQHLPASVQETVNKSHYDRVLRVTHHSGAAKGLVSGLVQRGIDTDIVHASDVSLRDGTVGTLVLGLANKDEAALDDAVQWIKQQGQLNAEVVN
jgi:ABC superfamily ATP binding cassette transporter, ABC protein